MTVQLAFSLADAERAHDIWGCNCGPAALAAVAGRTLDDIRPIMGDFERKRYTNPTLMFESLTRAGLTWRKVSDRPAYGLCRVQWEGPWTRPNVPLRARYRHTHWIGYQCHPDRPDDPNVAGVFDVNCMNVGGWISFRDWDCFVVPWILQNCEPRADGKWHFTHMLEVERPSIRLPEVA